MSAIFSTSAFICCIALLSLRRFGQPMMSTSSSTYRRWVEVDIIIPYLRDSWHPQIVNLLNFPQKFSMSRFPHPMFISCASSKVSFKFPRGFEIDG